VHTDMRQTYVLLTDRLVVFLFCFYCCWISSV